MNDTMTTSASELSSKLHEMSPREALEDLMKIWKKGYLSYHSAETMAEVQMELDRLSKFVEMFESAGGSMSKDRQRTASVYRAGFVAMCRELLAMTEE